MDAVVTLEIPDSLERGVNAYACTCGGYGESVDVTPEEEKKHGCGRWGCCARAFVCRICKTRWVGSLEAPDY